MLNFPPTIYIVESFWSAFIFPVHASLQLVLLHVCRYSPGRVALHRGGFRTSEIQVLAVVQYAANVISIITRYHFKGSLKKNVSNQAFRFTHVSFFDFRGIRIVQNSLVNGLLCTPQSCSHWLASSRHFALNSHHSLILSCGQIAVTTQSHS